jgi:hypothetical protein
MRALFATTAVLSLTFTVSGCGTCDEVACAEVSAKAVEAARTEWESEGTLITGLEEELLTPVVADIREGVRPWAENSIGICKGRRTCDEGGFLGTEVGVLPEGEYLIMAEFRVPNAGPPGTWKIRFDTECTTTRTTPSGPTESTSNSSREYDVRYAGDERGYKLMPLRTIESPSVGGARNCNYTITAPHPSGDKVFRGSWAVPEAPEGYTPPARE